MTTKSKTIIFKDDVYAIEREEYWGFRCQTTSLSWNVFKNGTFIQSCARLRDAKQEIARRMVLDAEVEAAHQYLLTISN